MTLAHCCCLGMLYVRMQLIRPWPPVLQRLLFWPWEHFPTFSLPSPLPPVSFMTLAYQLTTKQYVHRRHDNFNSFTFFLYLPKDKKESERERCIFIEFLLKMYDDTTQTLPHKQLKHSNFSCSCSDIVIVISTLSP